MPYRILHVHGGGCLGGVEVWLANLARLADPAEFELHIAAAELLQEEKALFQRHGAVVVHRHLPRRPPGLGIEVHRILQQHGPYHAVHAHLNTNSGFVLAAAKAAGVPIRIAHSHLDSRAVKKSRIRLMYEALGRQLIRFSATHGLAASEEAATALFGTNWRTDPRWLVHCCGIDLEPFACRFDRGLVRSELGIPAAALVVGHVGRFGEQKNQQFLFGIGTLLLERRPDIYFLLVGDGPTRMSIANSFAEAGFKERVIQPGNRYDVPRLMQAAMDVFVFPSLYEGLGLAAIEAQAAALPCIVSDAIPAEVDVIPELVQRLPLANASLWADQIEIALNRGRQYSARAAQEMIASSRFNVVNEVNELLALYRDWAAHASCLTDSHVLAHSPGDSR
jgi:glycosyltransferase involved in cell wall biosynthesis